MIINYKKLQSHDSFAYLYKHGCAICVISARETPKGEQESRTRCSAVPRQRCVH